MAQVCRRWLEIIKGAAELRTLMVDRIPPYANLALRRSKPYPIGLVFNSMVLNRSLCATALDHSNRWQRADIRFGAGDEKALRRLEDIDVSILRHLRLEFSTQGTGSTFLLDLFRDHPPKLTSLTLIAVGLRRWDSSIFGSHLHSLKLDRIRSFGPTYEDLRGVLCACPELAHLELGNIVFSGGTGGVLQGSRVELPLLHTLILRTLTPADSIGIARMVETPRCRNYSASRGLHNLDALELSAVALQIQPFFEACISPGYSLDIHLDGYWIHVICHSGHSTSHDFNLKLGTIGPCEGVFDWLNSVLLAQRPPLSLIHINIHLEYKILRDPRPSPSDLLRLSGVRSLTITDLRGYVTSLVEALSIPRSLENETDRWPWPSLREVTVKTFRCSRALLHMVTARTEAALPRQGTVEADDISMLEKLEIGREVFTVKEFEAVRAVLGDAAVM
ncbi:hypothetical protein FRB94_003388 [Tulasnella sp. JGI-2019a]|nr:hypothetical protein FRB93_004135 [Tulasnella sp. JGI-2019a]KAG9003075.1 hypothetical protein FRB94_003388 [Tulasnella sp. JGI-2019a]